MFFLVPLHIEDLAILDAIDFGLDVDVLRDVANEVNRILTTEKSLLMLTHYRQILDLLNPTHVHVMITFNLLLIFNIIASFEFVICMIHGFSLFITGIKVLVLSHFFHPYIVMKACLWSFYGGWIFELQ